MTASKPFAGADTEIVLGVSGGIAAYKACELLRQFTESGANVTVAPTDSALKFVGEATWSALSGRQVASGVFESVHEVPHVRLGRAADLVVVAPATADLMARAAQGRADDLLTATLLTARCPVLFVPAMHTEMWEHPATRDNVATLRRHGATVMEPDTGRLTGVDTGKGRLPEPSAIFAFATGMLSGPKQHADLVGKRVLVSAGGTREPIDPVRFIGNRSSGKQGYALARAAAARGAQVRVVAANVTLPEPVGAEVTHVETTAELRDAMVSRADDSDVIVMAAAPSDFTAATFHETKIKKQDGAAPFTLELAQTPDIAAELGQRKRKGQYLVTFAAETNDGEANARRKLERKNADLMVLNDVSHGRVFGADDNAVVLLRPATEAVRVDSASKDVIADRIWDACLELSGPGDSSRS
ncbi:MAG TPA: bifunctional phosphopantothenoylcysteine decarboxylase/phosphopantothenate--cysteine ligase CoaBC [Candidatus Stackebrandtia faecavium]|nr:bifunctional phosphopantothenoylcysteine decarboxylase/phosphopantothenate--cysteine ligase CoaBC [Candidatus Stackebrandtia faecavium]